MPLTETESRVCKGWSWKPVTRDQGESGAKTVRVAGVDTGSRSVPIKNNQRAVGGDGSIVGRFIQESSSNPPPKHVW